MARSYSPAGNHASKWDLLAIAVAGRERSVARRNRIVQSFMEVEQRVALALACPPVRQELIDAMLKFVQFAPERLQAASAHIGELRGDALGVLGAHRQLQPLAEPGDRELVVAHLVVGQAGGVVQPDVVWVLGLELGPDRGGLFCAPGAEVEFGDV
jgi:hypothetical protein